MTVSNFGRIHDENLVLKDAGLVAASAAAEVSGSAQIIEVGAGLVEGRVHLNVTAIEIASNDEIYSVILQGSDSATFASGIEELAMIRLGASETLTGSADSTTGAYSIPFANTNKVTGTPYTYLRLYTLVAGTIATGINYTAYLSMGR